MGGNSGLYQEMSWNKKNTSAPFNTLLGVINFTPKRILQFNIRYLPHGKIIWCLVWLNILNNVHYFNE